jgi:outer membrane protein OmpA-like peptidoglycan-associated protein
MKKILSTALFIGSQMVISPLVFAHAYPTDPKGLPAQLMPQLTPLKQRYLDQHIQGDLDKMVNLQLRLDRLPSRGKNAYYKALGNSYLEAARIEYLDNNEDGWESVAMQKAEAIATAIEQGKEPTAPVMNWPQKHFKAVQDTLVPVVQNAELLALNYAEVGRLQGLLEWASHEEQQDPRYFETCLITKFVALKPVIKPLPVKLIEPPPPLPAVVLPTEIHFALDKYYISEETKKILDQAAQVLQQYSGVSLQAIGHTDPRASVAYNEKLSLRRSAEAKRYLVEQHRLDPNRIMIGAVASTQPVTSNTDALGHAKNRRVELVFDTEVLRQANISISIVDSASDLQIESTERHSKK